MTERDFMQPSRNTIQNLHEIPFQCCKDREKSETSKYLERKNDDFNEF